VERKSRYLIAAKLANKTGTVTAAAVTAAFRRIPRALRHTLTLDNGREFTRFRDIEKGTGLAVYFADPYSAWHAEPTKTQMACCEDISQKAQILEM
jgi:IS30 family transposase